MIADVRFERTQMDREEQIVKEYLENKGYADIVYEPDGNIPPDFLVDNKIAIEVRRLNQNFVTESESNGLEEVEIPLYHTIVKIISEFDDRFIDRSYFVFPRFKRPLPEFKIVKKKLRAALNEFCDNPKNERINLKVANNLTLDLFPAGDSNGKFFKMAGNSDFDSGGWVISEMEKNIKICSLEKLKKVEKIRGKYEVWWLALVDYIGYMLSLEELKSIDRGVVHGHEWEKILVINPQNFNKTVEI
ncbi:MAG: hypothetical protein HQK65_22720 [Desulfamplus sp.]|nr:hypothetical protein [Desulfamplus sp.]